VKVLVLTNLFPSAYDPLRAAFNLQQFERLGRQHQVEVLTAVDFRDRLRGVRGTFETEQVTATHFIFVYPPRIGRSLHALFWLASLFVQQGLRLRRARYDCLLSSWAFPDGVAASWFARMLGIPYAIKVHGSDLNVQATYALRRRQIASALRHAGAVVAVSAALAGKAVELGADPARVHVVYNGVDPVRFQPGSRSSARRHLGLPVPGQLVLYVGNLKVTKGCLDLLESFSAVSAAHPEAHLVFVGEGPARSALGERSGTLGANVRVSMVGAVPHAELAEWFRAADVLCLPSHAEGVPNVVLEAMASGTPVVATRVGGIPEVVPDYAGMLVPVHDSSALALALTQALNREWDSARIAAHGREFDWEENVRHLGEILRDIVPKSVVAVGSQS
jgi:glycosyltransferase involved in cell wall biosynthesis